MTMKGGPAINEAERNFLCAAKILLLVFAANDLADSALIDAVSAAKDTPFYRVGGCARFLAMALKESRSSQNSMRFFLDDRGSWDEAVKYLDYMGDVIAKDAKIVMFTIKSLLDKKHESYSLERAKVLLADCLLDYAVTCQEKAMSVLRRIGVTRNDLIRIGNFSMKGAYKMFCKGRDIILTSDTGNGFDVMKDVQCNLAYKVLLQRVSDVGNIEDFMKGGEDAT